MAADADGSAFLVGEWLVEPELNRIVRNGEIVKIDPRNMRLLQLLASRPKQVVSQTEIEGTVWSDVVVTPNSVYQSIAQLRRALGDEKANPRYIETIARKGYRLVGDIGYPSASTDCVHELPTHVVNSDLLEAQLQPRRRARRRIVASGVFAATMIATFGLVWIDHIEFPDKSLLGPDSRASAAERDSGSVYANTNVPVSPHARTNMLVELSLAANNDGRPEDALAYAEQAVALERQISGDESPDTAEKLTTLALAYHWLADYEAAEHSARAALSIFGSTPVMHPGKIDALGYLGSILTDRGKFAEAAQYLEQAIELADRLYGESSGRAALSRCNLVALRNMEGRYAESETIARELLLQQAVNRCYRSVEVMVRTELATSLLRQERYREARAELVILLDGLSQTVREDHPYVASTHELLGGSLLGLGDYEQADAVLRKAISIWHQNDHWKWRVGRSASALGEALLGQGRIDEAETYLTYASNVLANIPSGQLELRAIRDHRARLEQLRLARDEQRVGSHARVAEVSEL